MDMSNPMVSEAIAKIAASKKSSFPWTPDKPYPQPFHTYNRDNGSWQEAQGSPSALGNRDMVAKIHIYSWNIDFMLPLPNQRMAAALDHLRSRIYDDSTKATPGFGSSSSDSPPKQPTVVLFQELTVSDLDLLQSTPWVQAYFHLTDLTSEYWESGHYGTTTLIDRRLAVTKVFRVHYSATKMERDGLFVDTVLDPATTTDTSPRTLRLCNTHLESLIANPPLRPLQLETVAKHMHHHQASPNTTPAASILGGDLNAIQPFDATLHAQPQINLHDAFLSLNPEFESSQYLRCPNADTWGFTAPTHLREQFGTSRMDKLLFCGAVRPLSFERFGWDVVIDEAEEDTGVKLCKVAGTEKPWVTDHLGIMAEFEILDGTG